MATFLSNLPSFNKDNFSNFQPNSNRFQHRKQSFIVSNRECPDEQIIVNQRCNLIIQYLEKQNRDKQTFLSISQNEVEKVKGKKRDISEVMKQPQNSTDVAHSSKQEEPVVDTILSSSKYIKKRRISNSNRTAIESSSSSNDDLIEIDDNTNATN